MLEKDYTNLTWKYPMALLQAWKDAGASKGREGRPFSFAYISGKELIYKEGTHPQVKVRVQFRFCVIMMLTFDLESLITRVESYRARRSSVLQFDHEYESTVYPSRKLFPI